MKLSLSKLLLIGVLAEVLIFSTCFVIHPELEETFRYAARYSGRLSAIVFLLSFYAYVMAFPKQLRENEAVRNLVVLFAVVHVIHFGFLGMNVYLNEIALVPVKLLGGALAYLMIVLAPFILHKLKTVVQLIYFYYVALVMTITYVARAKGDFEGAQPYWLHYVMLGVFVISMATFGLRLWKVRSASSV